MASKEERKAAKRAFIKRRRGEYLAEVQASFASAEKERARKKDEDQRRASRLLWERVQKERAESALREQQRLLQVKREEELEMARQAAQDAREAHSLGLTLADWYELRQARQQLVNLLVEFHRRRTVEVLTRAPRPRVRVSMLQMLLLVAMSGGRVSGR